jgi:hypothetical protein
LSIRNASNKGSKKSSKPLVLEKPAKFNPPSHASRLRKDGPRYPGPQLSAEQLAVQKTKKYPNMMPPEGSFLHWFINNRSIHVYITLGTLFSLALTAFITNLKRSSLFYDMLPPWHHVFLHPVAFTRTYIEVLRLHTAQVSAETAERRRRKVEDVQKRGDYRKAHGLDKEEGIGGWTAKTDKEDLGPAIPLGGPDGKEGELVGEQLRKKPLRKWLGIW